MPDDYREMEPVVPFVCRKCGCAVIDTVQHSAFHIALEATAFAPEEPKVKGTVIF